MSDSPGSVKALACCRRCGHFASVHHGGGGGRPGGSSCAATECDCTSFDGSNDASVPLGVGNLTAAEVAQLIGLSVHTLSYWRQSGQGPASFKAGTRTLYRRKDIEGWLARVDGQTTGSVETGSGWFAKAAKAADNIDPDHTAPWKLASTYALLAIADSLLGKSPQTLVRSEPASVDRDAELLTTADVAAIARLSVGTLRYWRHTGKGGPPSVKLGRRVLYRRTEVETWLSEVR